MKELIKTAALITGERPGRLVNNLPATRLKIPPRTETMKRLYIISVYSHAVIAIISVIIEMTINLLSGCSWAGSDWSSVSQWQLAM